MLLSLSEDDLFQYFVDFETKFAELLVDLSKLKLKVIQLMVKQQLTVQVVHRKISILSFIFSHTALNVQSYIDNNRHV